MLDPRVLTRTAQVEASALEVGLLPGSGEVSTWADWLHEAASGLEKPSAPSGTATVEDELRHHDEGVLSRRRPRTHSHQVAFVVATTLLADAGVFP